MRYPHRAFESAVRGVRFVSRPDAADGAFPPGPEGSWLSGVFPSVREDPVAFIEDCYREYGDVVGFRFFHVPCCLISDPEIIRDVLVSPPEKFHKSADYAQMKFFLGKGLLTTEGEEWRTQREIMQPAFHYDRIRRYMPVMVRRARRLVETWQDGQRFDVHEQMMKVTLEIIAETMFGSDVYGLEEEVAEAIETIQEQIAFSLRGPIPLPMWFPTPGNVRAWWQKRKLHAVLGGFIEDRREDPGRRDDLLGMLLKASEEHPDVMTARHVRDEVMTIFAAGHETTALALSWTLYLLAQDPGVDRKLREEVRAVTGGDPLEAKHYEDLEYTEKVIREGMRLYPPAWGVGRECREPYEVNGYTLPEGTQVMISQYLVHRSEKFYDDPETFDPDRWTESMREALPKYAYFPFGGGPRVCIGATFATMEAVLILAELVREYRFELLPDRNIELLPAVTLRPRHGIDVRIHRRA